MQITGWKAISAGLESRSNPSDQVESFDPAACANKSGTGITDYDPLVRLKANRDDFAQVPTEGCLTSQSLPVKNLNW